MKFTIEQIKECLRADFDVSTTEGKVMNVAAARDAYRAGLPVLIGGTKLTQALGDAYLSVDTEWPADARYVLAPQRRLPTVDELKGVLGCIVEFPNTAGEFGGVEMMATGIGLSKGGALTSIDGVKTDGTDGKVIRHVSFSVWEYARYRAPGPKRLGAADFDWHWLCPALVP